MTALLDMRVICGDSELVDDARGRSAPAGAEAPRAARRPARGCVGCPSRTTRPHRGDARTRPQGRRRGPARHPGTGVGGLGARARRRSCARLGGCGRDARRSRLPASRRRRAPRGRARAPARGAGRAPPDHWQQIQPARAPGPGRRRPDARRRDDADELVRSLGETARAVAWTVAETVVAAARGGGGTAAAGQRVPRARRRAQLRDGRLALDPDVTVDAATVLEVAARAAAMHCQIERPTLDRIATLGDVEWTPRARDAFIALLRAGRSAIGVFETLDHFGVLDRLLPEWAHVRARPQRNAYHRFTVDRHSLEAVAECATLLDVEPPGDGLDGEIARRARERTSCCWPRCSTTSARAVAGDHSQVGAEIAADVARPHRPRRAGTAATLAWLVAHHLLLADTATRRDLSDERTITRFATAVGDRRAPRRCCTRSRSATRAPPGRRRGATNKATLVRELCDRRPTRCLPTVAWRRPPVDGVPCRAARERRRGRGRLPRRDAVVLRARRTRPRSSPTTAGW